VPPAAPDPDADIKKIAAIIEFMKATPEGQAMLKQAEAIGFDAAERDAKLAGERLKKAEVVDTTANAGVGDVKLASAESVLAKDLAQAAEKGFRARDIMVRLDSPAPVVLRVTISAMTSTNAGMRCC